MSQGLADTSVFIARESGRSLDADALPDELAVSIITIGELRAGVLVADTVEQAVAIWSRAEAWIWSHSVGTHRNRAYRVEGLSPERYV